jgi:hypothetical protein
MISNHSVCSSLISVGIPDEFGIPSGTSTGSRTSRISLVDGTCNCVAGPNERTVQSTIS